MEPRMVNRASVRLCLKCKCHLHLMYKCQRWGGGRDAQYKPRLRTSLNPVIILRLWRSVLSKRWDETIQKPLCHTRAAFAILTTYVWSPRWETGTRGPPQRAIVMTLLYSRAPRAHTHTRKNGDQRARRTTTTLKSLPWRGAAPQGWQAAAAACDSFVKKKIKKIYVQTNRSVFKMQIYVGVSGLFQGLDIRLEDQTFLWLDMSTADNLHFILRVDVFEISTIMSTNRHDMVQF